jgi:hypothetical protein
MVLQVMSPAKDENYRFGTETRIDHSGNSSKQLLIGSSLAVGPRLWAPRSIGGWRINAHRDLSEIVQVEVPVVLLLFCDPISSRSSRTAKLHTLHVKRRFPFAPDTVTLITLTIRAKGKVKNGTAIGGFTRATQRLPVHRYASQQLAFSSQHQLNGSPLHSARADSIRQWGQSLLSGESARAVQTRALVAESQPFHPSQSRTSNPPIADP